MTIKEDNKEVVQPKVRNKRVPFGVARSKLSVANLIEGYHLRWINDEPGRIAQAQEGGYMFVEPSEVGREKSDDNKVKVLGGSQKDGSALYIYLMKISMEYHLEDSQENQAKLDKIDNAIRGGSAHDSDKTGQYIPKSGISLKRN
jgi:hypothetical protein